MPNLYSRLMRCYRRFSRYYAGQFAPLLAETGLSMRDVHVLLFLSNNPGLDTARDVSVYRGIAKSQVSAAVDLLAGQGILRRTPDAADRRIVRLSLTEAGMPLAQKAQQIQKRCWRRLLAGLTEREQEQLQDLLEKIFANCEELEEGELEL